jgi:RNA polymerase sigma-70 factor (ECF subfamily)
MSGPGISEVELADPPWAGLSQTARLAGQGDAGALAELVSQTSTTVWRVCAALVDRDSAEDLTQDTYLRAIRSLPTYRGDADPKRWLVTIARRVCAEEIARRQKLRLVAVRLRAERPATVTDPAAIVVLSDGLQRLTPQRRDAFVLTAIAGFSYAEAAVICDCPIGTIRSRVARARAELTVLLQSSR